MKPLFLPSALALGWILFLAPIRPAGAQIAQIDQNAVLYATNYQRGVNYSSLRGAPGKPPANAAGGTDGRAQAGGTVRQFQGVVTYGAVVVPATNAIPAPGKGFEQNAEQLNLPRGKVNGQVTMVLRSSQAGASTYSQAVAFLFGSVITPPSTDESGALLTNTTPAQYWHPQPYTDAGRPATGYYYSPHARQVFATVPGPIQITWRKEAAATGPLNTTNKVTIGGLDYALTNLTFVVSGSSVKRPRKLFWTEKSFAGTGKPISVPAGAVGAVNFVYNPAFPQTVTTEFDDGNTGLGAGTTNAALPELRTIWYDPTQGLVLSYNREGRVFMELLGDTTGSGTRQHLGFEIVDVFQQPVAQTVTTELGERITAYGDGRSDTDLMPAPVQATLNTAFLYQDSSGTSGRTEFYAAAETANPNDVLVHWLEAGIVGLRWPFVYNRYQLVWPQDVTRYSQYLRPAATTATEAAATAVQLPTDNVPAIQYQDPLDFPRAFLDESSRFYTLLDSTRRRHRTLLRFNSGTTVAFERVLSILSAEVMRGTVPDISIVDPRPDQQSALVLDGTGYGQLPPGVYFDGGSYTIEGWVNVSERRNWARLLDFGNGATAQNVLLVLSSGASGRLEADHFGNGTQSWVNNTTTVLPTNQWVHVASVFDAANSKLTLYVNGNQDGSGTITPPPNVTRTNNYIGKANNNDPLAKARIDSLRIWTTARTPDQLKAGLQANTNYPAGTPGLLVQFTFDEIGRYAYDSSGNNLHMELHGGAAFSAADTFAQGSIPRYLHQTAQVGDRINPPAGEKGGTESWFAGHLRQGSGTSFHATAYRDPFVSGFDAANQGAIIPINAIPGDNTLEVWWFRPNATNQVRNVVNGFEPVYWPAVIGRYTLVWPADNATNQIVLAGNAGSGGLPSLQAKGAIYTQNDPAAVGYNPNEEHALMLGGQAFALRDDLNVTSTNGFSSQPYVLLDYVEADGRPAIRPFRVRRENPSAGQVFDYVVEAGRQLQAPMPLPLLEPPLENITLASGDVYATNYNAEVSAARGDLPRNWNQSEAAGPFGHYPGFTHRDRKHAFWVMRGRHEGLPTLAAGTYNAASDSFATNVTGGGPVNSPSTNYIHTSRRIGSLTTSVTPALPPGVTFGPLTDGLAIYGAWPGSNLGPYQLSISDADGARTMVNFTFSGSKSQTPLTLRSTNLFTGTDSTFIGRPPHLAVSATDTNAFVMRFYYKTQPGFAWPNTSNPPTNGTVVPYLRPLSENAFVGSGADSASPALSIVYRPVWPGSTLPVAFGETLTVPSRGRPAIRGQSSALVLYQQSIALAPSGSGRAAFPSVTLHDPTRQKTFELRQSPSAELTQLPDGIYRQLYQGKTYFPNLPPHLANRFLFDPFIGPRGGLVYKGEFKDEPTGQKYVQLNVLAESDLATVKDLCPPTDPDKSRWDAAIDGLAATVETFDVNPKVPGQYIVNPALTVVRGIGELVAVTNKNTPVDSYALSAAGPGQGYFTVIVGDGDAFTPPGEPVSMYVMRVTGELYQGEIKVIPSDNPLSELITFEHTGDLAGQTADYEYEWKIAPPVDGFPPATDATMSRYTPLTSGSDLPRYTLGASGILVLSDNWLVMRYRARNQSHPLYNQWSAWTAPQFAEGYVKRVLGGINPFNQRVTDLNNNAVNTGASILTQAGRRYEGDVALNQDVLNSYGLIEIYETVLNRSRNLSIDAGINYGPANDSLLLAAGYISDLYQMLGDEAFADADNPTIGIGTKDQTYGDVSTALFAFKGQMPTLLEEELALLQGRDDVALPGVVTAPVYNRLVWNYTGGIDSGEVIYALNYNILDQNTDGTADAEDAAVLYPQGHGDAYGHYLTALKSYHSLLLNQYFDWVPRVQAVSVLGLPVTVGYQDERKFAAAAAAVARTGRQIFDLTWRKHYRPGSDTGWEHFSTNRISTRTVRAPDGTQTPIVRHWGADQWASRTAQGALVNWVLGNALLPEVDPDPSHEGIQKVDRTTVPELGELVAAATDLQAAMDNAEGHLSPLGVTEGSIAFDLNPAQVAGPQPQSHFEQIYGRAKTALNNALAAFDEAKDITRLMRQEGDSLSDVQSQLAQQELAFTNALIELYGTPYPDDMGPGKTYVQDYAGPDLFHYMYVETPELRFGNLVDASQSVTFRIDVQNLPASWLSGLQSSPESFDFLRLNNDGTGKDQRSSTNYVEYTLNPHGYYLKPSTWNSKRTSPGELQQAISEFINARGALHQVLQNHLWQKTSLDGSIRTYEAGTDGVKKLTLLQQGIAAAQITQKAVVRAAKLYGEAQDIIKEEIEETTRDTLIGMPDSQIVGLAAGGDLFGVARLAIANPVNAVKQAINAAKSARNAIALAQEAATEAAAVAKEFEEIRPVEQSEARRVDVQAIEAALIQMQGTLFEINQALQRLDDAARKVAALIARGIRLQQEREIARERTAAVIGGFSTRDAAFRLFRNEKLERYKTLFDLAARYALLAANAYDYDTGLLGTDQGRSFVSRIINTRALGIVRNGEPQFAGSNTGDPGLSSALAEMKADFDVLKGRLGFNSPDVYTTVASLRTGHLRILPDTNGLSAWQDHLQRRVMENILEDADVRRYCQQVDRGDGLPVPGIVLTFSTSINPGENLFGQALAAGDTSFHRSHFATKINSVGVSLEGYRGMNLPGPNNTADPNLSYLDPLALSATPYVYLIPVGVDAMRSPPLGDASELRQWKVDDVAIPLPFNIGGSGFSSKNFYQSADSLTEPLFTIRKHQAFRPVDSSSHFSGSPYFGTGLQFSQFTNRRLIGRSVWNSQWKLVIPADALLADPKEGLLRLIQTVTDIKIYFATYSYSGN